MSGRSVALGQLSPGKQEVKTSGGERDHRGPGLVTGPPLKGTASRRYTRKERKNKKEFRQEVEQR